MKIIFYLPVNTDTGIYLYYCFIYRSNFVYRKWLKKRWHLGSGRKTVNSQGYSEIREPIKARENYYSLIWWILENDIPNILQSCSLQDGKTHKYNHARYSVYLWIQQSEHPVIKCQFLNTFFPWEDQNPQFNAKGSPNFLSRGFIFVSFSLYKFISFQRKFNSQFLASFWSVIYQPGKSRSAM